MNSGHVYILGSDTGTLYIGATSDLRYRIAQHRNGVYPGFAAEHRCYRLLLAESFYTIIEAIAREKQLKGRIRKKKLALIAKANPGFEDLAATWGLPRLGPAQRIDEQ